MLDTIRHDDILELRLDRPPANALDQALIASLRRGVEAAPREGARALVVSGAQGMFSGGLDVPSLVALIRRHDPAERLAQWLTAPGNALRKNTGVMPSDRSAATMPPTRPATVVQPEIRGMAMASAMARGMTRR